MNKWLSETWSWSAYQRGWLLTHPFRLLSELSLHVIWALQRVFRGWDDNAVLDLDSHLAKYIPIWLDHIQKKRIEYIQTDIFIFNDKDDFDAIILGFQSYLKMKNEFIHENDRRYELLNKQYLDGLELFKKHFHNFWS